MAKSDLGNDLILTEKYGYDYIEIRLDMLNEYLTRRNVNELVDFFSNSKVKPYALNAIEEINFCDAASFGKISEQVKKACTVAEKINNPYLIVVSSFRNDLVKQKSEKDIEEDSITVLNKLADISEQFNVNIAFEPVCFKDCAVRNMEQAWNIVRKVGRNSVGLVIDAFNVYLYDGLKDMDVLRKIDTDKLFVFHINDCEGGIPLEDLKLDHRIWPGDGVIPLKEMLGILYKKGFDRIASVELFRPEYWDMQPEISISIGKLKTEKVVSDYYKA
jgi:2-keto-myo-inositol isomerase